MSVHQLLELTRISCLTVKWSELILIDMDEVVLQCVEVGGAEEGRQQSSNPGRGAEHDRQKPSTNASVHNNTLAKLLA